MNRLGVVQLAPYLLVGLAKVEFADHQKFTLKWAIAISMLLMIGSLLFGLYPLAA